MLNAIQKELILKKLSPEAIKLLNIAEKNSLDENPIEVVKEFHHSSESSFYFKNNIWEKIDKNDGIEMWSLNPSGYEYLYSTGGLRKITSYNITELITVPWHELFDRNEIHSRQIERALHQMIQTGNDIENICPEHIVQEKKPGHTVSALVKIKFLTPIFSRDMDLIVGVLAVTQIKKLSE